MIEYKVAEYNPNTHVLNDFLNKKSKDGWVLQIKDGNLFIFYRKIKKKPGRPKKVFK